MNSRIKKLRDEMLSAPDGICTERAVLVTRSYRSHLDLPPITQRALALHDILRDMTIYLRDGELLPGNLSSQLGARPLYPEYHLGVEAIHKTGSLGEQLTTKDNPEADKSLNCHAIKPSRFDVAEHPELVEALAFWKDKDLYHHIDSQREPSTRVLQMELIVNSAAEINGHGHVIPDYEKIMSAGLAGVQGEIQERLAKETDPEKKVFLEAAHTALQAVIDFSGRYADLCLQQIAAETDPRRKEELAEMARILRQVPAHHPQSFHEAVQFVWFIYLVMHQEFNGYSISLGRLDKILNPYYERDVQAGKITPDQGLELIENLCIKIMELPIGGIRDTKTASIVIGGIDPQGNYLCNAVSEFFLETIKTLRLNAPPVCVRWHKNAPEAFKQKALQMLKYGTGYPGLFGDQAAVKALEQLGVATEDAHEWSVVGCAELYTPGKSRPVDAGLLNLPVMLLLAANDGVSLVSGEQIAPPTKKPDAYASIDDLLEQYENTFTALLETQMRLDQVIKNTHRTLRPAPLASALMTSCIARGKDLLDGGSEYNFVCTGIFSLANLVDSLVAVDELVFKRKSIRMSEYIQALKENFANHAALREEIAHLPKYGNNDEAADRFIQRVTDIHFRATQRIRATMGIDVAFEAIPREVHIRLGQLSPATFDGRITGQPFADGIGPAQGRDKNGLTSVMQSVMKVNPGRNVTNGYVFNLKFHPRMLDNPDTLGKIEALADVFFANGGEQMQVICTRPEDLIAAQKNPERYSDLIVRVAGFSAYFTTLYKELQDEIISRTLYAE